MKTPHLFELAGGARFKAMTLASTLVLTLAACAASAPQDSPQMAVAEAAVQRATTTSTSESAPQELKIATTKLLSARQALAAQDYTRAVQLAEQAQLDARVAELHADSEYSRAAALESQAAAQALSEEISRQNVR